MFAFHALPFLIAAASVGPAARDVATAGHVQTELSFRITLNAPPDRAIRAFGSVAEQDWDPDWHPSYIFPAKPKDCEGAVFTVNSGHLQTWLLQTWDLQNRVVRYIAFDPGVKLSEITIRVSPLDRHHSNAQVTYKRTGLSRAGDEEITHWAAQFAEEAPQWAAAINAYLAKVHS